MISLGILSMVYDFWASQELSVSIIKQCEKFRGAFSSQCLDRFFCVPFLFGGRFFDFVVYMSMWRMFVARVCMPSLLAWSLIINLRSCCIAAAAA